MFKPNQQGQLIELSLKQRDQVFAYREQQSQPRPTPWQALRIYIPSGKLSPTPPPSPGSVTKAMARYK